MLHRLLRGSRDIPAVQILRRIWVQNYVWVEEQLHWRSNDNLPLGKQFINSPYDQQARYGKKRETRWTGYKIHVTETCEEEPSVDHPCDHNRGHHHR